jgi:hypothetical protein
VREPAGLQRERERVRSGGAQEVGLSWIRARGIAV